MSKPPEISAPPEVVPDDNLSCTYSDTSAPTASQTGSTSPTKSLGKDYFHGDNALSYSDYPSSDYETYSTDEEGPVSPYMYGGVYGQDDIAGQYLACQAAQQSERLQAPIPHHVSGHAGYLNPGYPSIATRDSYISTQPRYLYPDTESIRHEYSLYDLLPHIQPERKLNALGGPVLDIHSGSHTGPALCEAVPKKLLVLFLGRSVVSRYLRTISRVDNINWTGPPTRQSLILPANVSSLSALKILVAWMTRACTYATMSTMRPLAVPKHLFSACSLAQTLELFGLRRDADRMDHKISGRLRSSRRRLFAVEVETLWCCLGERNKYVYAAVKAFGEQMRAASALPPASAATGESGSSNDAEESGSSNRTEESACGAPEGLQIPPPADTTASDLLVLKERYPRLYDRIRSEEVNEHFAPQFGRKWFDNLAGGGGEEEEEVSSYLDTLSTYEQPTTSTGAQSTRDLSTSDATYAGGGGRRGAISAARPAAQRLDPEAEVFCPAAAWGGGT